MKSVKSLLFLVVALGLSGAMYSGCSQGFSGGELANARPEVRFVNVPPDNSTFSANPIISWVGTDLDGRIVEFRYVVARVDEVPAGMTPEEYALQRIPFSKWTIKPVTLDDPANRDTVSLEADSLNPVNVLVQQYLLLVAVDDKGAISNVVYRTFGRNDHFPETRLTPPTPVRVSGFVNVEKQQFELGGIPVDWTGTDPLDFPGVDEGVPLEFEWKLFGPYTSAESTMILDSFITPIFLASDRTYDIGDTLIDTAFDFTRADTVVDSTISHPPDSLGNTLDSFLTVTVHVDSVAIVKVDTTATQRTLLEPFGTFDSTVDLAKIAYLDTLLGRQIGRGDSLSRLVRSSFNPVTGDSWTTDRSTTFLDLYRDDPLVAPGGPQDDTTRQSSFLFWVRSRDDALVADPTPSIAFLPVIEALHERDLLIVTFDRTLRKPVSLNGPAIPCIPGNKLVINNAVSGPYKAVFARYIDGWLPGMVGPDRLDGFDTLQLDLCGKDSLLLPPANRRSCARKLIGVASQDFLTEGNAAQPFIGPTLRDILKHKVVIYAKDRLSGKLNVKEPDARATQWLVQGGLTGVNFWVMSRATFVPGAFDQLVPEAYGVGGDGVPQIYSDLFGIRGGYFQAWYGMGVARRTNTTSPLGVLPVFRNEDFVGGVPSELVSTAEFPSLTVSKQKLFENHRWADSLTCEFEGRGLDALKQYPFMDSIGALPEVDFVIPITSAGTETLYLYKSRFGEAKYPFFNMPFGDFQGTVVAVRLDRGFSRTSHWAFTPLALEPASFQTAFNSMMDWLFARPWGGPSFGRAAQPVSPPSGKYASKYIAMQRQVESTRQKMLNEAFSGQRYFKNQFEYEQQLKDYLEMKRLEDAAEQQVY